MLSVELESETDFNGWRRHARGLALNDVPSSNVVWTVGGAQAELLGDAFDVEAIPQRHFSVPKEFIELAEITVLHRNPERFALLYRLLLRLRDEHALLDNAVDADVAEVRAMARAVRRDEHKMHAFVRFREVATEQGPHFVAWFEPAHHIAELAAPFFAERFADMNWSILTPDRCVHWDKQALSFTAGAAQLDAPSEDRLEDIWRSYYASIFNPARLKVKAMQTEMPKKYWRNLPEASLIKPLISAAERTATAMIEAAPEEPARPLQQRDMTMSRQSHDSLSGIHSEAEHCRDCPLWENATQTVFGEGPQNATVMLVGEQPGDKEDLAGKPFVGPAGQMLDRALAEAGVDRRKTYITNAVKHFKFVQRGKMRLHQKPATPEIRACRQWYERELKIIRPELVVALGATAAQSVFGKLTPINKNRGRVIELDDGTHVLVTVHPSYLLRLPDEDARRTEYERFVDDLKIAARYLKQHSHAA